MFVGMARISVVITQSHSLKEKRMVLRRIKDRVRERLGIAVAEVGDQDVWQRAELGVAVASGDKAKAHELIDEVVRVIAAAGGGDVVAIAKDAVKFDTEAQPIELADIERTGSGDKAVAAGDETWIPEEWKSCP